LSARNSPNLRLIVIICLICVLTESWVTGGG